MAPAGSSAKTAASLAEVGSLPVATPPNLMKSFGFKLAVLTQTDHDEARSLEPSGTTNSNVAFFLPLNARP